MKRVSCLLSAAASCGFVVIVAIMLTGCVSNSKYEDMRERAERAEAAYRQEREISNSLMAVAKKQGDYIRELHSGMELQARMAANLRYRCDS